MATGRLSGSTPMGALDAHSENYVDPGLRQTVAETPSSSESKRSFPMHSESAGGGSVIRHAEKLGDLRASRKSHVRPVHIQGNGKAACVVFIDSH